MSTWHYYNEKGEKITVTGGQLKGLAKAGVITPDTIIETEGGKTAPAGKIKGLTFLAMAQPEAVSPPNPVAMPTVQPTTSHVTEANDAARVSTGSKSSLLITIIGILAISGVAYAGWKTIEAFSPSREQAMIDFVDDENTVVHDEEWAEEYEKTKFEDIWEAAESGTSQDVEHFLENGISVNAKNGDGDTPLHWAASSDNLEIVEYLISQGADVNIKDNDGETPLHHAASFGSLKTVKFLVSKGANVSIKNNDGETPLDTAEEADYTEVTQYLVSLTNGSRPTKKVVVPNTAFRNIWEAASKGTVRDVKYFIDSGISVNAKSGNGGTPLHYAASAGSLENVKFLLSKRADYEAKDNDGRTPLHIAVMNGNLSTIKSLCIGRFWVVKDKNGRTPFGLAVAEKKKADKAFALATEVEGKKRGYYPDRIKQSIAFGDFSLAPRERQEQVRRGKVVNTLKQYMDWGEILLTEDGMLRSPEEVLGTNRQIGTTSPMPSERSTPSSQEKRCPKCDGRGTRICSTCNGKGYTRMCSTCNGTGIFQKPYIEAGKRCSNCNGTGKQPCNSGCNGTGQFPCNYGNCRGRGYITND